MNSGNLSRRSSYVLLFAAMVIIAAFAVKRTFQVHSEDIQEHHARAENALRMRVQLWEETILRRVASMMVDMSDATNLARRERYHQGQSPWMDGFYLWVPNVQSESVFLYPERSPKEDPRALIRSPCMVRAANLMRVAPPVLVAQALRRCTNESLQTRVYASWLAARLLMDAGFPSEAWEALGEAEVPLHVRLQSAPDMDVSVQRLAERRWLAAEIQGALGNTERQSALLVSTVNDVASTSGPDLEMLLPSAQHAVAMDLPQLGVEDLVVLGLQTRLDQADRRMIGYREVADRLSKQVDPQSMAESLVGDAADWGFVDELRVVHDTYTDPGFLLVYGLLPDGARAAAFQLNTDELLNALMEQFPGGVRSPDLVILDADEKPIRGGPLGKDGVGGPELWVQVPFVRLLPHLRLGRIQSESQSLWRRAGWMIVQLAPIGFALLLGVFAMTARVRADNRERELYERQQDFIARVTHELKTPLAGIRVMAETLELGAVEVDKDRMEFLQRIIQESERLGLRIDEVLTVGRSPEVSPRTPVEVDQLAAEVVEQWTPRFATEGAVLETDLVCCSPVAADPALLRDALNNLVDNALKYMRPDRVGRCLVRTSFDDHWVKIEVIDNGLGVPVAMRKRIFERFRRVEGPGRGSAGGHGLGLAFVAEAASAHSGLVECSDGIEGGACFVMKLRKT